MAIQEALSLIAKKSELSQKDKQEFTDNSFTAEGLQYLFKCYDRIEDEKRLYPRVKYICSNSLLLLILLQFLPFIEVWLS